MILLLLWQQKDMMGGVGLVAVCWAAGVTEDLQTDRFFAILEVRMSVQQNVFDDSLVAEEVVSRGNFFYQIAHIVVNPMHPIAPVRMSPEKTHKLMGFSMEVIILGVNTMYMLF